MRRIRRSSATPLVTQERRIGGRARSGLRLAGIVAMAGFLPIVPGAPSRPAGAASSVPAVFAASAEAWAYSAEVGVPGPLGPLASHTTVSVDNSPHAQGAAGLADPGFLIRAAAQLVAGVPTPAYCESAWPEGPDHADCGAPGGAPAAVSRAATGDQPNAVATAALGNVAVGEGPPALTVGAQSTTSSASFGPDGLVHARADVTLSGIALAGGALKIGTLAIHREATADGLPGGAQTTTGIEVADATVAGTPVAPGADAVRSLADAARKAFGDKITVDGLAVHQEQTPDGKLVADSSGLQILWRPQPDRSVRIVLGYGRVLVYATAPAAEVPAPAIRQPDSPLQTAETTIAPGLTVPAVDAHAEPESPVPAGPVRVASGITAANPPADRAPPPGNQPASEKTAPPPLVAIGSPLAAAARPPVRWVSPFLVLAQMTTGRQAWWFLLALLPLVLAAWLSHRSGLGLLAPWATGAESRTGPDRRTP